jgi:hypothetical protein
MCREKNFSAVQEHCPPEKNRSPFVAFPTADLPKILLLTLQKACYNENSALRVLTPEKGRTKIKAPLEGIDAKKKAC